MIEMRVGSIERHPATGAPLVALEPRSSAIRTRLVLPLSAAVACSLSHEIEGQATLRSLVYTLVGQLADILGGEITAVEIVPAPNDMAAGRLRIDGPGGPTLLPVEIALGIGLAVVLDRPLCVADELVHSAPKLDKPMAADTSRTLDRSGSTREAASPAPGDPTAPAIPSTLEVPDAFRRAFS